MFLTFEEARKRILICGASDVEYVLPKYDIGMVFITKPYLDDVDYKEIPTHICYIPEHFSKDNTPQIDRNNEDVEVATNFLEENPDQYLLIHCNAGACVSPSFAFMLLARLQGDNLDLDEVIRTIHKMTIDVYLDIMDYAPYLPISIEDAKKLKADHMLAKSIYVRSTDSFQTAFSKVGQFNEINEEDALNICRRFGFHVEQGPKAPDQSGVQNAIRASLGFDLKL